MIPRTPSYVVVFLAALVAPAAAQQSDLTPTIYDVHFEGPGTWVSDAEVVEGCAQATTGRTLLRFGTRVMNFGPDDLVIGDPGCPDCTTNPGAVCQDPRFICSAALGLPHFQSAARFELLDPTGADVVVGGKRGYCFNDDECIDGKTPVYTDCSTHQGLSVGCTDDYEPFLYCQYLDVTDVPNVMTRAFTLRVSIDTADLLPDPNRTNNVVEVAIPGCGDGIVQPGEDCDPGAQTTGSCCDATCHFATAGTTCRPAAGPCDVAEVCSGTDGSCPADVAAADGTPCGSSLAPCADQVCESASCTVERHDGAGCLIGGACFVAGSADPSDSCQRCDPSAAADAWSPVRDPDSAGVICAVKRAAVAAASVTCPHRVGVELERRLARASTVAARLATARPGLARKLTARLVHLSSRTTHLVESAGCASSDLTAALGALRDQLNAMHALQG